MLVVFPEKMKEAFYVSKSCNIWYGKHDTFVNYMNNLTNPRRKQNQKQCTMVDRTHYEEKRCWNYKKHFIIFTKQTMKGRPKMTRKEYVERDIYHPFNGIGEILFERNGLRKFLENIGLQRQ